METTYLDLPSQMAQEYMDAVFREGPTCQKAKVLRDLNGADPEWGKLFLEFADAVDALKRQVSGKK